MNLTHSIQWLNFLSCTKSRFGAPGSRTLICGNTLCTTFVDNVSPRDVSRALHRILLDHTPYTPQRFIVIGDHCVLFCFQKWSYHCFSLILHMSILSHTYLNTFDFACALNFSDFIHTTLLFISKLLFVYNHTLSIAVHRVQDVQEQHSKE